MDRKVLQAELFAGKKADRPNDDDVILVNDESVVEVEIPRSSATVSMAFCGISSIFWRKE